MDRRIARFAFPPTRMLLSAEGLTTTLLTAWLGTSVRVRRAEHRRVRADEGPVGARTLLRVDGAHEVLIRDSVLATADGRDVSRNLVVARLDLVPAAEQCLTNTSMLLGQTLHAAGTGYRRSVVDAGLWPWEQAAGAPAAYKTYVLWHGDEPLAAISETFHPDVVPATVTRIPSAVV